MTTLIFVSIYSLFDDTKKCAIKVPLHAHEGILNIGSIWRGVVSVAPQLLYPPPPPRECGLCTH
jgi:hypothetical protein